MNNSAQIGDYIYSTKAIGKGSFSKVYKGFNTITDTIVAIKVIEKAYLKPTLLDRLHTEITLLTQLCHENIAELLEFLEDDDNCYLILEYCAGGDLSHMIKKGRISEETSRKYMTQLSNALRYLKSRNIIHRDLKPQNILLTGDFETIKITDFNFARELYDDDLAQTLCGSPLYMAPEIINSQEYTVKSDLWSVGMILYEMVYGTSPYFDAINIIDLIKKINTQPILYTDRVSPECNELLQNLLQKDPAERFNWDEFFSHNWLRLDEPSYLQSEQKDIWESISLSTITPHSQYPTKSSPINITQQRFHVNVVDNYVPLGISPPKYTKSEPVGIYRVHQHGVNDFYPRSAPENKSTLADHLWHYMTSSVDILKGAVDYISTADPRK